MDLGLLLPRSSFLGEGCHGRGGGGGSYWLRPVTGVGPPVFTGESDWRLG